MGGFSYADVLDSAKGWARPSPCPRPLSTPKQASRTLFCTALHCGEVPRVSAALASGLQSRPEPTPGASWAPGSLRSLHPGRRPATHTPHRPPPPSTTPRCAPSSTSSSRAMTPSASASATVPRAPPRVCSPRLSSCPFPRLQTAPILVSALVLGSHPIDLCLLSDGILKV